MNVCAHMYALYCDGVIDAFYVWKSKGKPCAGIRLLLSKITKGAVKFSVLIRQTNHCTPSQLTGIFGA